MEPYRIIPGHAAYFVTFTVVQWLPIFVSLEPCQIVIDSLNHCHNTMGLRINAYVIMPTHLHAILFDVDLDEKRFARSVTALRKFTGRRLSDYCTQHLPLYDRILRESADLDRERQFWQSTKHPEAIFTRWFWQQKFDYLHDNPCRKGLVQHPANWRFSSAAYWLGERQENDVILTSLEW